MAVKISGLPLANKLTGDEIIPIVQNGKTRRSRIKDVNTEVISIITANYTLIDNDGALLCDASSGSFQILLPNASGFIGKEYEFKKIDNSSGNITIISSTNQFIDGSTGLILESKNDLYTLRALEDSWIIVSEKINISKKNPQYKYMHKDITAGNKELNIPNLKKGISFSGYSKLIIDVDILEPNSYVQLLPLTWNPLLNKYVAGNPSSRIRETRRFVLDVQSSEDVYLMPIDIQGKVTVVVGGYNP